MSTTKPLAIDVFCGLGGWTEGLLDVGYQVIGFDTVRHIYGAHRYPAQLVLQDARTIHGAQFRHAALIVASSPCQEFSYRAMPWKRAKALPPPYLGMELFAQAERIQREACEAAGHHIPMVQENVCGAQKWVGRAKWHYGSYYLWGDVPALMPFTTRRVMKSGVAHRANGETNFHGSAARARGQKNGGGSWFKVAHNTTSGHGRNPDGRKMDERGVKHSASGPAWFDSGPAAHGSRSSARKAASARIAKIPFPLAQHIARTFYPHPEPASHDPE